MTWSRSDPRPSGPEREPESPVMRLGLSWADRYAAQKFEARSVAPAQAWPLAAIEPEDREPGLLHTPPRAIPYR